MTTFRCSLLALWPVILLNFARACPALDEAPLRASNPKSTTSKPSDPSEPTIPAFEQVKQAVDRHFAALPGRKPNDLISQSDVVPLLGELASIGWKLQDPKTLLQQVLGDGHVLVQQLRSPQGVKFMRKTASYEMIYDRLERVSEERGGQALIRDLVKLPDGEKYAKKKTARAVPDLVDLLPKDGSGLTRSVKQYDKPTGRIYTQDQLLKRLQELHQQACAQEAKANAGL